MIPIWTHPINKIHRRWTLHWNLTNHISHVTNCAFSDWSNSSLESNFMLNFVYRNGSWTPEFDHSWRRWNVSVSDATTQMRSSCWWRFLSRDASVTLIRIRCQLSSPWGLLLFQNLISSCWATDGPQTFCKAHKHRFKLGLAEDFDLWTISNASKSCCKISFDDNIIS